jgi:hypothetical protein
MVEILCHWDHRQQIVLRCDADAAVGADRIVGRRGNEPVANRGFSF